MNSTPPETISDDSKPGFHLIPEAWNTIERVYVDRTAVKPKQMTYGAISGMVDSKADLLEDFMVAAALAVSTAASVMIDRRMIKKGKASGK
jgi:hypothetical protein